MYSLVGYMMVFLLVYLLLKGKTTPITTFITLPIIAALILGFSLTEIGAFASSGISTTMSTAVLFIFSIMYFGIMNDAGMFDGLIDRLVAKAGTNVVMVTIITAIIGIVGHLDGSAATTALVTIPAMLPIYKRLNIRPQVLLLIVATGMGVMNLVPWGGPTARTAVVLGTNANEVWHQTIPIQIAGIIITIGLAIILGMIEKKRGAGIDIHSEAEVVEAIEVDEKVLALKRPKLAGINIMLTILVIAALTIGTIPSHVIFMVAFSIAMFINYPNVKDQNARFKAHSPSALTMAATMMASGVFVGIMGQTGILDAMAATLLAFIPDFMGSMVHIIIGILALPIGVFLGTDAYFYGLLPLVIEVAQTYDIDAMNVAVTMLVGKNVSILISPMVSATFLAIGLAGVELRDHIKFSFFWLYGISLLMLVISIITGVVLL